MKHQVLIHFDSLFWSTQNAYSKYSQTPLLTVLLSRPKIPFYIRLYILKAKMRLAYLKTERRLIVGIESMYNVWETQTTFPISYKNGHAIHDFEADKSQII